MTRRITYKSRFTDIRDEGLTHPLDASPTLGIRAFSPGGDGLGDDQMGQRSDSNLCPNAVEMRGIKQILESLG